MRKPLAALFIVCSVSYSQYVGSSTCGNCHPDKFASQSNTGHAHALSADRGQWQFGAGIANYDFSIFKGIDLTERFKLQFRTEFFNIFNRVQFGPPGEVQGNAQFGVVSSQLNLPRLVQFALRLNF